MISESKIRYLGTEGVPHCVFGKETPNTGAWRTYKPLIDLKKCVKCRMCWLYCPESAISLDKNDRPRIDYDICKGCLICSKVCPVKCMSNVRDLHKVDGKSKNKKSKK